MEALERLERVDRELTEKWRYVSVELDVKDAAASKLTYATEEEEALEESFNDAIQAYEKALDDADEYVAELHDPVEIAETKRSVKFFRDQSKRLVVNIRKLLVAYRQRAKMERLEQARAGLMGSKRASANGDKKEASSGTSLDVTAALKRTRQVMSQEIERVSSVTKVLDVGRTSLRSSHEEFGSVQAEIGEVRKRLVALQASRQDRMWIAAGIVMLVSTVLYIVYERTGLIII
uniref:Sec20 C-terminal domain-containing protein n=1 Tax=Globisporangium ultimum (strain ATCC 200006 / CBS 805.95 / DAOM BR144) TaxID=431595 RepID=K3WDS0_GLOUD